MSDEDTQQTTVEDAAILNCYTYTRRLDKDGQRVIDPDAPDLPAHWSWVDLRRDPVHGQGGPSLPLTQARCSDILPTSK